MRIAQIIEALEAFAPLSLQESYDNSGLLIGDAAAELTGVLVCLDVTESVIAEAVTKGCNLVVSHHPLIFTGIKRLTGENYQQRVVRSAIKNDVALYAMHTNLDNVSAGVNRAIGEQLGMSRMQILQPKAGLLKKLSVFVPKAHASALLEALFEAGAGAIGDYTECSFSVEGVGTYLGNEHTDPFAGEPGKRHHEAEHKVEVVCPNYKLRNVLAAMINTHPYEEVAYDLHTLDNSWNDIGAGMIGQLSEPVYTLDFLQRIKQQFGGVIRHTELVKDQVQKVAWCGGSGSFLLNEAKKQGADLFLTSDFKYHQFFDADNELIIADIGHYENEQHTIPLIAKVLREKFPNFAVLLTEIRTNPVNYY